MPWTEKQIKLARFAEHNPSKVSKKNKSILSMSPQELHEMSTWTGAIKEPVQQVSFKKKKRG